MYTARRASRPLAAIIIEKLSQADSFNNSIPIVSELFELSGRNGGHNRERLSLSRVIINFRVISGRFLDVGYLEWTIVTQPALRAEFAKLGLAVITVN